MARSSSGLSEVSIQTTVPEPLAAKVKQLSTLESLSVAATTRRLISVSVDRELARLQASEPAPQELVHG